MTQTRYQMHIRGPMRLLDPNGGDITPTGGMIQALLGLLVSTKGAPWARASLQDKLWSTRGQAQGRDSLKKALASVRKLFGEDAGDILETRGMTVTLRLDRIWVDLFDDPDGADRPFLDGLDVRDPEFSRWLLDTRAELDAKANNAITANKTDASPATHALQTGAFVVAVMVPDSGQNGPSDAYAHLVADRAIIALKLHDLFSVHDFRGAAGAGQSRGADVTVNVRALMIGQEVSVSLSARRVLDNAVIWSNRQVLRPRDFNTLFLASLITEMIDELGDFLMRDAALGPDDHHHAARKAMGAIDMMFRLANPNLNQASADMIDAIDLDPRGTYLAWYAYHTVFRMEEQKGRDHAGLRDHADALIRRVLEVDPHNPLARSLLTHIYSFVFRDFERAGEMIRPLRSAPPDTPMYYDALGSLHFYTGGFDDARTAAQSATLLGQKNPYNYAFSTVAMMIDTMRGDFDTAIRQGEQVLAMHPKGGVIYEPVLRYLSASYAHQDRLPEAARTLDLLRTQSPTFDLSALRDPGYPVPSSTARDVLLSGLERIPSA